MKRSSTAHFRYLLILALLLSLLGLTSIAPGVKLTSAQAPQVDPVTDAYGNTVRDGGRRFNYLVEEQGGFTRVALDEQGQIVSSQSLPDSPFGTGPVLPLEVSATSSTSQVGGSDPLLLSLEWEYGLYGSGIGLSRISVFDIDGDNTLEMIMGGSSGGGFGADDFWYVVQQTGPDTYDQVWLSDPYPAAVNRIAVADVDADGTAEIYVGLSDGQVYVYDGLTLEESGSFTADGTISALVVADADGDGSQEIVTSDGSKVYVYSALSYALEWASTAYGGDDLAVGDVDADPAPEIVTTTDAGHGYVLDGVSHVLEWDYIASFGNIVELGDVDGDGLAEIIGAASWYKITAFDADIKTPKWEIPTDLDIGALHVADTDGDGVPEILFGDGQWGAVHCYDAATQIERWSINNPEHGVTDIALADVNGDTVLEVLWGAGATSSGADYLYVADSATRLIEWQSVHVDGPLSAVDVGDVDDDGDDEIVMVSFESNSGYDDGIIHIFDAATHTLEWRSTDLPNIDAWSGVKSVRIGDVDDDGQTEFVIATAHLYDGLFQVYDGKTHVLERQSAGYSGASFTALAIGDVDEDSQTEIVAGQVREHTGATGVYLIVFNGATATEEWKSVGLDTTWGSVYDIELSDLDGDSNIEMVASVAGERLYVYDGVTHQLDWLAAIPAYALDTFDVDADGQEEILVGRDDGTVEVYDGSTFTLEDSFNLGAGPITGLLLDDIDQSSGYEWLVTESTQLSVFQGATKELLWQRSNMGSSLANLNHINSRNIDSDENKEIVLGSSFALYQFDVAKSIVIVPPAATLISPSGVISDTTPTYAWDEVETATWYRLWVDGPSGTVINQWYRTEDANCASGVCAVTPATELAEGPHTWWVQTWNEAGYGPWSRGLDFWVGDLAPPGVATLISPSGAIADATPSYTWDEVPTASWYRLWVEDALGVVVNQWYRTEDICPGGSCAVDPGASLADGPHVWWVQTWNIARYGPWSAPLAFHVGTPEPPGPVTLISPSGVISEATPTYTWDVVSSATWYRLLVEGPSGTVVNQWYKASNVCDRASGLCEAAPDVVLEEGGHSWWVKSWNAYGSTWSGRLDFSVSAGASGASPTPPRPSVSRDAYRLYLPVIVKPAGTSVPPPPGLPVDDGDEGPPPEKLRLYSGPPDVGEEGGPPLEDLGPGSGPPPGADEAGGPPVDR